MENKVQTFTLPSLFMRGQKINLSVWGKLDFRERVSKAGFTLAEVLITLGVIGIVAALTIPGLITAHRKKVIETRLAKFYSTMNQAIKLAEYDYDDRTGWDELGKGFVKDEDGNDTNETVAMSWVQKYLIPYIKSDVKATDKYGKVQLHFQDGSMVTLSSASWVFYPDATKYYEAEDKGFNQIEATGKYAFTFYYAPSCTEEECKYVGNGVEPYKYDWDGTKDGLLNGRFGCAKPDVIRAYCTELIKQNGWKIPSDYPIKI